MHLLHHLVHLMILSLSADLFHFIYCPFNSVIFICFFFMVFVSVEFLFNVIVFLFFQLI